MNLSDRFKIILNESDVRQKDFANSLGISEGYLSQIINGKRDIISETLALLIQEKYYYSPEWVMFGKGDKFTNVKNSIIKQKTASAIDKLNDAELKAVIAFVYSLEDVQRILSQNGPPTTIAANNKDRSLEQQKLMKEDIDELE